MIELVESKFGELVLEKDERIEEFSADIVIHPDDKINLRDQEMIQTISDRRLGHSTGHAVWKEELEQEFGKEDVTTIFVGTGMNGVLKIPEETMDYAESKGIHIVADLTPRILRKYNKAHGKKAAILHLTC